MRIRRYRERVPFTRRQLTPVWLVLGTIVVLILCGCSGLFLYAIGQGRSDGSAGPASTSPAGAGQASATAQAAVPAAEKPAAKGDVVVPNVVGVRLSDAKKYIKAAGFTAPKISDITGKNRVVLVDSNWVVGVQEPAAGTKAPKSTRITLKVAKPTDLTATAKPIDGVVPNVLCKDLSSAKKALHDSGFYVLSSTDGTGKGRHQFIDSNWIVTAQSAGAGSRPKLSTRVTLTVVKSGEPSACK